jgi:hypothetical protein
MSVDDRISDKVTENKVSIVTILHGEKEFIPLIKNNYNSFINKEDLELVIIDDGKESLSEFFNDLENCIYLHLNKDDVSKFMDQIEEGYKQPNKSLLYYQRKTKTLPNGFKRDYGSGMSSHDYIFHMNADCIYNKKAIEKKLQFLKRVGAECVFCDTTLCYDIYGQQLYKTQSPVKIYESTLFHTREFWKRKGFKWSDTQYEGKQFHYNNGIDRKMDNYYDTIQLLSIHNMNEHKPVKVTLENMKIDIPELVSDIEIKTHPFQKYIEDLFDDNISILGMDSDFLKNVNKDTWSTYNITEKWKQTKLAKLVKGIGDHFNVLLFNAKHPAWDLFNHVPFDIICLETSKNFEQMTSIIMSTKTHEYINVNGIFIRKDFLESKESKEESPKSEEQENTLTEGESERTKLDEEDIEKMGNMIDGIIDESLKEKELDESYEIVDN